MNPIDRRQFLRSASLAAGGLVTAASRWPILAQSAGDRPPRSPETAVLNPRGRVPVSLIIDDSTCLVNMAHFAIPQFAEVFPDRYRQDWRRMPREIPDAFVRRFGEWSRTQGVKGKYSMVPYPSCVGWLDRDLPGWSRRELIQSLDLVRSLLASHWDFHPEMISHTWVINTRTGRPYEERTDRFMENWRWTDGKSADELADYLAYALRILERAGIPCEGITTPGGFGNRVLPELAQATLESCRAVFRAEIPHYFRHVFTDNQSVAPRVEYASGLDSSDPRCVVSIVGCTGDWFGGWDGLEIGSADQFLASDAQRGRMADVIRRGEPAIMVCHWPGLYCHGAETGFHILQEVVRRMEPLSSGVLWMKLSEIARYWTARELTRIQWQGRQLRLRAPFACPGFTVRVKAASPAPPAIQTGGALSPMRQVQRIRDLAPGTWLAEEDATILCFDLPKGPSAVVFPA